MKLDWNFMHTRKCKIVASTNEEAGACLVNESSSSRDRQADKNIPH